MFRPAREEELEFVWEKLKPLSVAWNAREFRQFWRTHPNAVQVSASGSIGIVGKWRAHLDLGSIWAFSSEPPEDAQFLEYLLKFAKELGPAGIVSPLLIPGDERFQLFRRAGFREAETILVLTKGGLESASVSGVASVRPFQPSDLEAVVAIELEAFDDFWRYGLEDTAAAVSSAGCFVALCDEQVVGYNVNVLNEIGVVGRLAVLPSFQGMGIGRQLLANAANWFVSEGTRGMQLLTQRGNRSARRLYAAFGFKPIGMRELLIRRD